MQVYAGGLYTTGMPRTSRAFNDRLLSSGVVWPLSVQLQSTIKDVAAGLPFGQHLDAHQKGSSGKPRQYPRTSHAITRQPLCLFSSVQGSPRRPPRDIRPAPPCKTFLLPHAARPGTLDTPTFSTRRPSRQWRRAKRGEGAANVLAICLSPLARAVIRGAQLAGAVETYCDCVHLLLADARPMALFPPFPGPKLLGRVAPSIPPGVDGVRRKGSRKQTRWDLTERRLRYLTKKMYV